MEQQCFGQKNWDILGLFILAFPAQLIENKIFRFQDWNRGSLVSEATVLPTEPLSLPRRSDILYFQIVSSANKS